MSKKSRKALKIALSGAKGRMGQEIAEIVSQDATMDIAFEIERFKDWKKVDPAGVDIVVDFSNPKGMSQALNWSLENSKPFVSGTTGISTIEKRGLKKASKKIPVLYSANMSVGIAVFTSMLRSLGAVKDWDFQIEEAHHLKKKDKPSGTALLLQDAAQKALGRRLPPPLVVRGGGVPGIHQIWVMGPEESLTLQHTAFKRTVFARGALKAARWLFDKNVAGIYDLSDLYPTN